MVFMRTVFTLDWRGVAVAVVLGILLLFFGGANALLFFLGMLFFLVVSAVVTRVKINRKSALGVYEPSRGWKNVLANGSVPLFVAFLYFLCYLLYGFGSLALTVAFLASVAAITADKFSSEIGILDKHVFMLIGRDRVRPGVSGGVSVLGFAAGLLGAALIAGVGFLFGLGIVALVLIIIAGMFGDVVDSLFGYYENKGIGSKFTTNVACAGFAALFSLLLFVLLRLLYLI